MDPDELYTLRSQYWLGQYSLCIDEGKSIARRPMSADLKAEREEFVLRAQLALGQYDRVINEAESPNSSVGEGYMCSFTSVFYLSALAETLS